MDGGGDEVEPAEHLGCLVELAVVEDVDLDARHDGEGVAEGVVDRREELQLLAEALR